MKRLFTRVFVVALAVLAAGVVVAWTGPTAAPPNSNVSTPLNVSGTAQTKSGALLSSTYFSAPVFYDSENTNYYADPTGTSRFNALTVAGQSVCLQNGSNCPAGGGITSESDTLQTVTSRGGSTNVQANFSNGICLNGSCRTTWPGGTVTIGSSGETIGWVDAANPGVVCSSGKAMTSVRYNWDWRQLLATCHSGALQ